MRRTAAALTALLAVVGLAGAAATPASGEDAPQREVTRVDSDPSDPAGAALGYARLMTIPSVDNGYKPRSHAPRETPGACPPGRCRDYRVRAPRGVRISNDRVRVLLPVGYASKPRARYPVIYLLNGAKSHYRRWSEQTDIVRMSRGLNAIFVMPSGGEGDEAGMFSDWKDGSWDWETYHLETLLPWVDRHFRTKRGARGVVGASMGGLGAMLYPARHRGVFKSALSISGVVDTTALTGSGLPPEIADGLGMAKPNLSRVWGSPVLDRANWDAHNPTTLAPRLKGTQLFVASGTGSGSTVTETGQAVHSGFTEQLLWTGHRSFLGALTAAGVPYHAYVWQGGVHNWPWFDAPLRWALPQMVAHLRR